MRKALQGLQALESHLWLIIIQCETPFTTRLLISPPIRHGQNLPSTKEQENKQHAEVESRIESRGQDVVPPRPERVPVAISPEHHHEATDQAAEVACADVSVEVRHGAEEDGRVPEVELGSREEAVQDIDEDWGDCA